MANLEKAILIAVEAHQGQKDKAGKPYILHPLRVMFRMASEKERIAAVLHDIVEDTEWTPQALRKAGFSREIVKAVDSLSRRDKESYSEFIARVKLHPLARKVKLTDLEDNMDISRIHKPGKKDWARIRKYRRAIRELGK